MLSKLCQPKDELQLLSHQISRILSNKQEYLKRYLRNLNFLLQAICKSSDNMVQNSYLKLVNLIFLKIKS